MKRLVTRTIMLSLACVVPIGFAAHTGCGGDGGGGGGDPAVAAPSLAAIRAELGANNPLGMVVGRALGAIVLPPCAKENTTDDIVYAMTGLPAWLSFDAAGRALTLADGVAAIPAGAYEAAEAIYACALASDATVNASQTFVVNDLDGGGIVDAWEYDFGAVPLVNHTFGWIWLNPDSADLYRPPAASPRKIPTGIVKAAAGLDPTNAADDTADFDGDGMSNLEEIIGGTNLFVAASDGTFADGGAFAAGTTPKGIAAADLNGDGFLDLVVSNGSGPGSSVISFTNDGSGTFANAGNFTTETTPVGIALADFNGDGVIDAAAATNGSPSVSVLLGNGDGTFGAFNKFTAGNQPNDVVAADFDGDGIVDLAVANELSDNVSILIGKGDGTFEAAVNVDTFGGSAPTALVAADFNADGDLDLAVACKDGFVRILANDGSGNFGVSATSAVENSPSGITAADVNGDGIIDLAVTNFDGAQNISLLMGKGDGTFEAYTTLDSNDKPREIIAADFDGDGDIDLAATRFGTDLVSVWLNEGSGTFAAAVNYKVGSGPWGIVAADLNGNGKLDLAAANSGAFQDSVSILLND